MPNAANYRHNFRQVSLLLAEGANRRQKLTLTDRTRSKANETKAVFQADVPILKEFMSRSNVNRSLLSIAASRLINRRSITARRLFTTNWMKVT